jgi:hypothetical protein
MAQQLPTIPINTTTLLQQKMQKMASLSSSMMSMGLFKLQKAPKKKKYI